MWIKRQHFEYDQSLAKTWKITGIILFKMPLYNSMSANGAPCLHWHSECIHSVKVHHYAKLWQSVTTLGYITSFKSDCMIVFGWRLSCFFVFFRSFVHILFSALLIPWSTVVSEMLRYVHSFFLPYMFCWHCLGLSMASLMLNIE